MLCGDIRTEMVEYEICFVTSALSHFGVYFSHLWITLVSTKVDVLIAEVPLVDALVLDNLCEYRYKSCIS